MEKREKKSNHFSLKTARSTEERERKKALFTHSKTWHGNLVLSFFSLLILLSSQLISLRERELSDNVSSFSRCCCSSLKGCDIWYCWWRFQRWKSISAFLYLWRLSSRANFYGNCMWAHANWIKTELKSYLSLFITGNYVTWTWNETLWDIEICRKKLRCNLRDCGWVQWNYWCFCYYILLSFLSLDV